MKIFAIHGAFSTPRIFAYLEKSLPEHEWTFLDYRHDIANIGSLISRATEMNTDECHVVGHSMGGLVALALAELPWAKSITTIATPLGGVEMNMFQTYLSRSPFLSEISTTSKFINLLHSMDISKPTLHIVTTKGFNPYMTDPNDGVVTIKSQRAYSRGIVKDVEANHAEVMMSSETVRILQDWWV